jgi:putative ABC transport system permease protein
MGIDENFFLTAGGDLAQGRNFTELEALSGQHLAVIGSEIRTKVMPTVRKPVGQYITVDGVKFLVIGVLVEKGSSFNSGDRGVYVPLQTARQYFGTGTLDFRINVMPTDFTLQASAVDEAEGTFRMIRRLGFGDDSDFELSESDSLSKMLIGNLSKVSLAATFIGIITLIGAAIGLMNIMLVAVAERTREIGTRKAIGAKASTIKQQFLFESIIIGQLGGFLGIVFGVGIGNLIALSLGSSFIIPWLWIFMGVMVCFVVGIASGIIPAIKASKLDPIDALRYE